MLRVGVGTAPDIDLESARPTQAADRRRVDREGDAVGQHEALTADFLHEFKGGLLALVPGLQRHEDRRRVALVAAAD